MTLQTYNTTIANDILANIFKDNFTTDEQQLFIQNFKMYLEYGEDDKTFPVDFDIVWKWCGFTRKSDAKQLLLKFFKETHNFIIKDCCGDHRSNLLVSEQSEDKRENNGGHNKVTIMLNVSTFKKFCLKASTKKADEIHDYYIKMEKMINKYFKDNFINTQKMLNEKDKKYLELELKSSNDKELARHNALIKAYNKKCVVYLLKMKSYEDGSFLLKIGRSDNLQDRISKLKHEFALDIIVLDVFECELNKQFEHALHHDPFIYPLQYKDIINNDKRSQECFLIKDSNMYDKIVIICNREKVRYLGRDKELFKLEVDVKKLELLNKYSEQYNKEQYLEIIKYISVIFNNSMELSEQIIKNYHEKPSVEEPSVQEPSVQEPPVTDHLQVPVQSHLSQGPIVQVYDGEDTSKLLYIFDNIMECTRKIKDTSFTKIKIAAKNKQLYRGYRWHFLNRKTEKDIYSVKDIGETVILNEKIDDLISLLNIEKNEVIDVFTTQQDISKKLSCSGSLVNISIKYGSTVKGYYVEYWSKLPKNIQDNYLLNNTLPEKKPINSILVQKLDKNTNEVLDVAYSIEDANRKFKISTKTFQKYSKNNEIYDGFRWKLVK